jgi:single-strand DNA-binding protein
VFNQIVFTGQVEQVEMRQAQNSVPALVFPVTVTERWQSNGMPSQRSIRLQCTAWADMAEQAQLFVKEHAHVVVVGSLDFPRPWVSEHGEAEAINCVRVSQVVPGAAHPGEVGDILTTTLVGNLGRDPEMRYTPDGIAVADFSMAVNETWVSGGQRREKTIWSRITTWGGLAEVVNDHLEKGRCVLVTGRPTDPGAWIGQDGKPKASLEITGIQVKFLGQKADGTQEAGVVRAGGPSPVEGEDEIPF